WCQENFFAYMMEHYDIDGLVQYGAESLPGTLLVVNPTWRELDKAAKAALREVQKIAAKLGVEVSREDGGNIQKKAEYVQDLQTAQIEQKRLRAECGKIARKVTLDSLPEEQRPTQLLPLNKQLADTVKMIAYRAETAMVVILRRHLQNENEARALARELLVSSADIEPDEAAKTLTIRIHRMASPVHDNAIAALLDELTKREFHHPETGAKMIYVLV
ncbi:MAG: putative transposase, partial [Thermodesulfobacteriota bacterium]